MRLKDKVITITGAGAGMGRAMALLFSAQGAKLALGELNQSTLDEVVAQVKSSGGEVIGLQGNVAVKADAEGLVERTVEVYGRIDVMVNNAGILDQNFGVGEMSDALWERVIGVNLNGPMYTCRKAVQHMRKLGGGNIINVASTAGLGGSNAGAAYTASKSGVVGLTRNIAWMYTLENIRCNAICPGGTMTPMAFNIDPTKLDPHGTSRCMVGYGTMPKTLVAEDIAQLALFLASDESKYMNGVILPADHGWRAA